MVKNRKYLFGSLLLFLVSVVSYGVISDFPKVISGYPDELRYVGIARSLAAGEGLKLHGAESDFQKILYSICIMPAFLLESTVQQIRLVGYLNSLLMASSVFPIYALCRDILKEDKQIAQVLALWFTFPAFVYTIYFMSEVIYLPLSFWVVFLVWRIFCTENIRERLCLNALLGVLCYLTYLNKEIALYFVIAYILVFLLYCISDFDAGEVRQGIISLAVFAGIFAGCFLLMKGTVFKGLHNSYSSTNLQVLNLKLSWEKVRYLLYGFIYNVVFAVLAFGIFPVFVPTVCFSKKEKESWLFLFLLCSFLIGCVTVSYMITLPEDFGSRAPRLHMRYLEPLITPFYILMADKIRKADCTEKGNVASNKQRFFIMGIGILLFALLLIGGSGGGSFLADNSTLLYYELFARFLSRSETALFLLRLLIVTAMIIGYVVFYKNRLMFLKLFGFLFMAVNIVNSAAGICAGHYRYGIQEEERQQAVLANEYLKNLQGNILLFSVGADTSPEDKRLFDTYMDTPFYVCDIDSTEMQKALEDAIIDLASEQIVCDVTGDYYSNLGRVDYLVLKADYHIRFREDTVEEIKDFPLEGYHVYRNLDSGRIYAVLGE